MIKEKKSSTNPLLELPTMNEHGTNSSTGYGVTESKFSQFASGKLTSSRVVNQIQDTEQTTAGRRLNVWKRVIALPAYYWILISLAIVSIPHYKFMPFWLVSYSLFSVLMQLPKVKGYVSQQGLHLKRLTRSYRVIQLTVFTIGVIILWQHFGGFNVESGIGFLLLCLASKMWELYTRRDAFILLNLSLFVCASLFLMDQGLGNSIAALLATLIVMMAFIAMNDDDNDSGSGRLRSLALIGGLAVPLMVVLFVFFPRMPPLWSFQLSSSQATTGISDSMSPGDFSGLSKSTKLAFRAEFAGKTPSRYQMYWRGLVFNDFDGKTWREHKNNKQIKAESTWMINREKPQWLNNAINSSQTTANKYQIMLEPTNQSWLFALDYPINIDKNMELSENFTITSIAPIVKQQQYKGQFNKDTQIGRHLTEEQRQLNLTLPAKGNEKARNFARKLYSKTSNPALYAENIATWIQKRNFRYTLSPPKLGQDRIDQFLFETQAGFCEHYSSSFTFLMRAAGVPARVVVGYQGGALSRDSKSWEVRQMDAHAWSEIWIENQGWVRYDPTGFVSPERVEGGMDQLTANQGASIFGDGLSAKLSYQQFKALQKFRRLSDQISYYWRRDIVGYDRENQNSSLLKWFNIKSLYQQIIWMFTIAATTISLTIFIIWFRRRKQWHIADKELMKLAKRLQKIHPTLAIEDHEGLLAWIERLQTAEQITSNAEFRQVLQQIKQQYRSIRYGRLGDISSDRDTDKSKKDEYQMAIKELNYNIKHLQNLLI